MALSADDKVWLVQVIKGAVDAAVKEAIETYVDPRFEAMDKKMDRKFADMDRKFVAMDKKIDSLREERKAHIHAEQGATIKSMLMIKKESDEKIADLDSRVTNLEDWKKDVTLACQKHTKIA